MADKFEEKIIKALMVFSTITASAKIAETEIQELIQQTQELVQLSESHKAQGGLTEQQWKDLQKERDKFIGMLDSPQFQNKLNPAQKKQVDGIKAETYKIFKINAPIHFHPPKQ
jgi:uncharacterized coiled-coil DUF342 family protein